MVSVCGCNGGEPSHPSGTSPPRRNQGEYWVKTKSRALAASWQGKQVRCFASSAGVPSLNWANPQPPVDAYFLELLTMNWIPFTPAPATKDWARPKALLFSSDETYRHA